MGSSDRTLDVDVAVVGASVAGCTVAHLLGRAGVRVALVERHGDPRHYKRLCGHYLQSSATPILRRLGVVEAIERAGGVRNGIDLSTPWGWIRPRPRAGEPRAHGYSVRRLKLDPILRGLATETAGVTYLGGHSAVALDPLTVRDRSGAETRIAARLVVGADGKASTVARLAGARERRRPNHRFCYMAYYEGLERDPQGRGTLWLLGRDVLIAAPNDDGITLLAAFVHKRRLPEFKADRVTAFERFAAAGRSLDGAHRIAPLVGYIDYPAVARPPVPRPEVALVGDAALTCDPTLAIGCGWALQSAAWLVDAVLAGLRGEEPLERGLGRYARMHRRRLSGHARMIDLGALAKPPSPPERLMLRGAARDAELARHLERYLSRSIPVRRFLSPAALARAALV